MKMFFEERKSVRDFLGEAAFVYDVAKEEWVRNPEYNHYHEEKLFTSNMSLTDKYVTLKEELNKYLELDSEYQDEKLPDVECSDEVISTYDLIEVLKKEFMAPTNACQTLLEVIKEDRENKSLFSSIKLVEDGNENRIKNDTEHIRVKSNSNFIRIYFECAEKPFVNITKNLETRKITFEGNLSEKELDYLNGDLIEFINDIFNKEEFLINNYDLLYVGTRQEIIYELISSFRFINQLFEVSLDYPNSRFSDIKNLKANIRLNTRDVETINLYYGHYKELEDIEEKSDISSLHNFVDFNIDTILKKIPVDLNSLSNNLFSFGLISKERDEYNLMQFADMEDIYFDIIKRQMINAKQEIIDRPIIKKRIFKRNNIG